MLEVAARQTQLEQAFSKLTGLVLTVLIFALLVMLAFWLAERASEKIQRYVKYLLFLTPALVFPFHWVDWSGPQNSLPLIPRCQRK